MSEPRPTEEQLQARWGLFQKAISEGFGKEGREGFFATTDFTFEFFCVLLRKDCVFCGGFTEPMMPTRYDRRAGFDPGNVFPCCYECHSGTELWIWPEGYLNHVQKVVDYQKKHPFVREA